MEITIGIILYGGHIGIIYIYTHTHIYIYRYSKGYGGVVGFIGRRDMRV